MSTERISNRNEFTRTAVNPTSGTTIGDWLTIERLIYGCILFIGGFMRFFALEAQPLNMGEAATSILAWTSAMGFETRPGVDLLAESVPPTSPLFYSLQGILFWVAGGSDAIARFWPAVAGTGLVLLPWFVRMHIGRYVAMALALLFAIDPWLVTYSRLADGISLTALLGLIVLFGLSLLSRSGSGESSSGWRNLVWLAAGLLIVSGTQAWSFAIIIALYMLLFGLPSQLFSTLTGEEESTATGDDHADSLTSAASAGNAGKADMAEDGISTKVTETLMDGTEAGDEADSEAGSEVGDAALDDAGDEAETDVDNENDTVEDIVEETRETDTDGAIPVSTDGYSAVGNTGPVGIGLFVGAVLLGATGWLAFPEGLSFIGTSITHWVEQLVGTSGLENPMYSMRWLRLRLLADQPLLILFGIVSLLSLWMGRRDREDSGDTEDKDAPKIRQGNSVGLSLQGGTGGNSQAFDPQFLTLWALFGLILVVLPGRGPLSLMVLGLPLLLASAALLGQLAENLASLVQSSNVQETSASQAASSVPHEPLPWSEIRLVLLIMSGLWVLLGFVISALLDVNTLSATMLLTGLLVLGIALLLCVILALMTGWKPARSIIGLYVGALLCLVGISSSWHLNHRNQPSRPDAFFGTNTSTDIRTLVEDIRTISAQRIGDPEEVSIRAELGPYPNPVLAWNLRNMRNLSWTPSPAVEGGEGDQSILLTFGDSVTSRAASESYLGSDYSLSQSWLPDRLPTYDPNLDGEEATAEGVSDQADGLPPFESFQRRWTAELRPLMRWVLYRKVDNVPTVDKVVLWTRGF